MSQDHTLAQTIGGFFISAGAFALFCLLPNLAVTVRRLHDTGRSAWWLLLYLPFFANLAMTFYQISWLKAHGLSDMHDVGQNPLLGLACLGSRVYLLYLMRKAGDSGPNAYGPDPKKPLDIAGIFDAPEPAYDVVEARRAAFDLGTPTRPHPPTVQVTARQTSSAPVFGKRHS